MDYIIVPGLFILFFYVFLRKAAKIDSASGEKRRLLQEQGPISFKYVCPHCLTRGMVRTIQVKRKKGISGAKATGAVLTMGVSTLATGLSRKEDMTHATCGNCGSVWDF